MTFSLGVRCSRLGRVGGSRRRGNVLPLIIVLAMSISAAGAHEIYVSPQGNDGNPGTVGRPLATLQAARDAVRRVRLSGEYPTTVYLGGGTYHLSRPLKLTAEDSGTLAAPVVWKAAEGETPIVSGAIPLKLQWQRDEGAIWQAQIPAGLPLDIDELFVADNRQRMARFPNYDPAAKFFGGTSADAISKKRVSGWASPAGGYVHALHSAMWGSKHYRIESVTPDGEVRLQGGWQENRGGGFDKFFRGGFHKQYQFVENIREELDAPGEWFLDQTNRTLYFQPEDGVDPNKAPMLGARLMELIVIQGTQEQPVRHVRFEGITFRHTARVFMQPYERLLRGDWSIARLAALRLEGAEDCHIDHCHFEDLGGNGVLISRYNRRIEVTSSRFTRLGESAICLVGDRGAVRNAAIEYGTTLDQNEIDLTPGPKTPDYPARCRIHDNLIDRLGMVGKQTAGVMISMSEEITVSHNTIYNIPRAAICINDGCWGGHVIEYNDAFNTVRESGDHGPFNSWGRDRFWKTSYNGGRGIEPFAKQRARLDNRSVTHIRNNRFSHPGGHSWGIDLDDGSSNYHVYNNLCLGMGVKLREGFFRRVENNVIVGGFGGFHIWLPGSEDVVARNIFVSDEPYQFIRANPAFAEQMDYNLFYSTGEDPKITGVGPPKTLVEWKEAGFDQHSLFGDPHFVNSGQGDYRVRDDSPALKLGFRNFSMNQFGVLDPAFQLEASNEPRLFTPAMTKPGNDDHRSTVPIHWFGATIKNVTSEGERSAAAISSVQGVLLLKVPEDSPAAKAGFVVGHVILAINGRPVHSLKDLLELTAGLTGKRVKVHVGGNAVDVDIYLNLK